VKFLLNMNLPPAFGQMLASEGHGWRHVANLGMSRASDAAILAEAKRCGECVITHDLDYGQLLAFSGDSAPPVVIFRLRRAETTTLHERMRAAWNQIEGPLAGGAVVIIEEAAIRIRVLPISKKS
jgi:predicted nuclease of predicted toxin-antitoxin system